MTKRDTQAAEYASESQSAGLEQREPPASIPGPGGEGSIPSTADAMATSLRLTDAEREAISRLSPSGDPEACRTVTLTPAER